jgi:hypothetical protein
LIRKYGPDFFEKLKDFTGASEEEISNIMRKGFKDFRKNVK